MDEDAGNTFDDSGYVNINGASSLSPMPSPSSHENTVSPLKSTSNSFSSNPSSPRASSLVNEDIKFTLNDIANIASVKGLDELLATSQSGADKSNVNKLLWRSILWRQFLGILPDKSSSSSTASSLSSPYPSSLDLAASDKKAKQSPSFLSGSTDKVGLNENNDVGMIVKKCRDEYDALKAHHTINPWTGSTMDDPLSGAVGNSDVSIETGSSESLQSATWAKYYADCDLMEEIRKDLDRLHMNGCGELFQSSTIIYLMQSILFVWAKMHPKTKYRQGMHEILAIIIYTLHHDIEVYTNLKKKSGVDLLAQEKSEGNSLKRKITGESNTNDDVYATCFSLSSLENDSFWIFYKVLEQIEPLYFVGEEEQESTQEQQQQSASTSGKETKEDPLIALGIRIQNDLLHVTAPDLCELFQQMNIEPQLYLLSWLRLMFSRVGNVQQVVSIWDHLFAYYFLEKLDSENNDSKDGKNSSGKENESSGFVSEPLPNALAMFSLSLLISRSKQLLAARHDESIILKELMSYPPIDDPLPFIDLASKLHILGTAPPTPKDEQKKNIPDQSKKVGNTNRYSSSINGEEENPPLIINSKNTTIGNQKPSIVNGIGNLFKEIGAGIEQTLGQVSKGRATQALEEALFHDNKYRFTLNRSASAEEQERSNSALVSRLTEEIINEKNLRNRMGSRLMNIALKLEQSEILAMISNENTQTNSSKSSKTTFLKLIAELKQVGDVLLDRIKEDDCLGDPFSYQTGALAASTSSYDSEKANDEEDESIEDQDT